MKESYESANRVIIGRTFRCCIAGCAALLTIGCSETSAPSVSVKPPVENGPPALPSLPGISAAYMLKIVNNQPLPVKSPYGAGQWDYDEDAGTWQLTHASFVIYVNGTYSNAVSSQARSGATGSQTFSGTYTRISPSTFEIHANGSTSIATISGNQLIWKWGNGDTLTFEQ